MSRQLVLDASAALEAILGRHKAESVLDRIEGSDRVQAPDLYATEVANGLWKHVRAGDIDIDQAQTALRAALDLVDALVPAADLIEEALATATTHAHPVYDALYLVTARRSGATVCTLDRRLATLLDATRVPVELI
jgi:predicted nucleic acid-binding protein